MDIFRKIKAGYAGLSGKQKEIFWVMAGWAVVALVVLVPVLAKPSSKETDAVDSRAVLLENSVLFTEEEDFSTIRHDDCGRRGRSVDLFDEEPRARVQESDFIEDDEDTSQQLLETKGYIMVDSAALKHFENEMMAEPSWYDQRIKELQGASDRDFEIIKLLLLLGFGLLVVLLMLFFIPICSGRRIAIREPEKPNIIEPDEIWKFDNFLRDNRNVIITGDKEYLKNVVIAMEFLGKSRNILYFDPADVLYSSRLPLLRPENITTYADAYTFAEKVTRAFRPKSLEHERNEFFVRSSIAIVAEVIWQCKDDAESYGGFNFPFVTELLGLESEKLAALLQKSSSCKYLQFWTEAHKYCANDQFIGQYSDAQITFAPFNSCAAYWALSGSMDKSNFLNGTYNSENGCVLLVSDENSFRYSYFRPIIEAIKTCGLFANHCPFNEFDIRIPFTREQKKRLGFERESSSVDLWIEPSCVDIAPGWNADKIVRDVARYVSDQIPEEDELCVRESLIPDDCFNTEGKSEEINDFECDI